jgi:catechol 2,3-dioxygenase-like lactoylglutathione lyase family enzyme
MSKSIVAENADVTDTRSTKSHPRSTTQEIGMSTTEVQTASPDSRVAKVNMKLENQVIPVSDVDRSKQFYESLGWRLDDDVAPMEGLRIVQFTPQGSGTSVTFGEGLTTGAPGSAQAVLVVSDIEVAHAELVGRGIAALDVWHGPPFPVEARQPGVDPGRASYGSFSSFNDPDGNVWIVQEVTTRIPGRVTGAAFASTTDLEGALRRAESAHSEHEQGIGHRLKAELAERVRDEEWPTWYASYIVAEQSGTDLPK